MLGCHRTGAMSFDIALFIWLFYARLSHCTASGHGDKSETVGWQSDPNNRGTFTLVSSCVLTLIICVYSALHLNVPRRGESALRYWARTVRWAHVWTVSQDPKNRPSLTLSDLGRYRQLPAKVSKTISDNYAGV